AKSTVSGAVSRLLVLVPVPLSTMLLMVTLNPSTDGRGASSPVTNVALCFVDGLCEFDGTLLLPLVPQPTRAASSAAVKRSFRTRLAIGTSRFPRRNPKWRAGANEQIEPAQSSRVPD